MRTTEQSRTRRDLKQSRGRSGQRTHGRERHGSLSEFEVELRTILGEILNSAIDIAGADYGDIQLLDSTSSGLRIVAHRGFPQWWLEYWSSGRGGQGSGGQSLSRGKRVIVEDVAKSSIFTGKALKIQLKAGVRAVQSTPIVSRSGKTLGIFSTQYKKASRFDKGTLRLLDLLARQAGDIIEHAQAKAAQRTSEERLRRVFETETIAVLFWDNTGTLIEANDTFLRMTGYTQAEVQRRELTWRRLTPPEWIESSQRQLQKLAATGHIGPYDKEYFLKGGSRRWMMFVGRDLGDGTCVEFCVDITARKRMEEESQREGRRKDEFLSLLSHELRNPLTAISFATQLLRSDVTGQKRASLEETIARQVGLLRRLVDDLLDLARITHGQISLKRESINLVDFLQRVVTGSRSLFISRGQEFILQLPSEQVSFLADGVRLEQVVMNLLINASKYTAQGGRIELSGAREGADVVIRCKDNGDGIPIEMQVAIFESFTRGPMTNGSHGDASLGIGLALVKQLTELHGGTVSVESAGSGMGSEFVVRLPLVRPPISSDPKCTPLAAPPSAGSLSILMVEDNPDVAHTMQIALEQFGHKVTSFGDGFSALSGLLDLKPDAALIDIGLPAMDGYELVAKLRKIRNLRHTLFIAVSGFKKRAERGKSREPFDHYLVKPVNLSELLTLLSRHSHVGSA